MISDAFRILKTSFNKRLLLYFSVVVCFTLFGSMPFAVLKIPFLIAFIPFSVTFIVVIGRSFLIPNYRFLSLCKRGTLIPAPEQFKELGKKMGYPLKEIRIIQWKKKNAFATPKGIAFTTQLLKEFSKNEILAVTAHEIAHKKGRHSVFAVLLMIPILVFTAYSWSSYTSLTLVTEAFTRPLFQVMMETALLAFMMVAMIPASWVMELKADSAAARFVGKEHIKSALRKLTSKRYYSQSSESHPSIKERIKHIDSLKLETES